MGLCECIPLCTCTCCPRCTFRRPRTRRRRSWSRHPAHAGSLNSEGGKAPSLGSLALEPYPVGPTCMYLSRWKPRRSCRGCVASPSNPPLTSAETRFKGIRMGDPQTLVPECEASGQHFTGPGADPCPPLGGALEPLLPFKPVSAARTPIDLTGS